jgi:hypothetical protein
LKLPSHIILASSFLIDGEAVIARDDGTPGQWVLLKFVLLTVLASGKECPSIIEIVQFCEHRSV